MTRGVLVALMLLASGCGLTLAEIRKDLAMALDLSQAACVLATEFTDAPAVALACRIDAALVPAIEALLKSKAVGQGVAAKAGAARAYTK